MADNKNYFEFLDIPDGSGGSERWHARDAEAAEALNAIPSTYATKSEVTQATIIPVDLDSMTPETTFVKNNILAINGVQYLAKKNTMHFPVVLLTDGGQFVVNVVNGAPAYVVDDYTLDPDWEVWGDAGIPQTLINIQADLDETLEQIQSDLSDATQQIQADCNTTLQQIQTSVGQSVEEIEADQTEFISEAKAIIGLSLKTTTRIKTSDGQTQYTVQQLLTALADLMSHTVVVNEEESE